MMEFLEEIFEKKNQKENENKAHDKKHEKITLLGILLPCNVVKIIYPSFRINGIF